MQRRRRALLLFGAAAICALFTVLVASRLQRKVTLGYGPMRTAVVVAEDLRDGQILSRPDAASSLTTRRIPVLFIPPGTLSSPEAAIGSRISADLTSGTYLQASLLKRDAPGTGSGISRTGRRPVEVSVSGAGALTVGADAGGGIPVDVVVSAQPGMGKGRTEVVASGVPLIRLSRPASPGEGWKATVAVSKEQALRLIAAEASGRTIRLLPLGISPG